MSTTTTTDVELRRILRLEDQGPFENKDIHQHGQFQNLPAQATSSPFDEGQPLASAPANAAVAIPEGGYGWVIVTSCAIFTFWFNGISGCWGVIQAALLRSKLESTSTATISFVGTLGLACIVAFGLFGVRLARLIGSRNVAFVGIGLLSLGEICSSFTTSDVGGLFATSGVLFGLGGCLLYAISNTLPTQYFSARLGLASGLVKLGGGIGAAILAPIIDVMIRRMGIPWAFRILGFCMLAMCAPAAWFIQERVPVGRVSFIDVSLFRNLQFTAIFFAGAIGTFALFVPPFFLPLVAQGIGLSSSSGAGLVGGFNACTAVGRFAAGWTSDHLGPLNMFLLAMLLNAVSMLAIWPVSNSLAPLIIFVMLNGVANGAFFTLYPVVVASTAARIENGNSGRVAIAMSMAISGWTGGYLMGVPIAGYLLQASNVKVESVSGNHVMSSTSIGPYRPAIFYAGGVALAAAGFVLVARVRLGQGIRKRV